MRPIRVIVLAMLCAAVMLPTAQARAASCNGASHQLSLSSGAASPGAGTTATAIRFSVRYVDTAGCVPSQITVSVAGVGTFPLSGSGDYQAGVVFQRTMTLPAGRHAYSFRATSGSGAGEKTVTLTAVSPATVVISAPTPVPLPPPTPKPPTPPPPPPPPPPTPKPPTPGATATPTSTATPTPSTDSPSPSGSEDAKDSPISSPSNDAGPTPRPTRTASATPTPSPSPAGPVGGPVDWDDLAGFGWLDLTGPIPPWVIAYLVTTAAGLAFYVALMRRRVASDPTPVNALLPAAEAVPEGTAGAIATPAAATTEERSASHVPEGGFLRDDDPAPADDDDARVPRWLRPSVRAARQEGIRYPSRDNWG